MGTNQVKLCSFMSLVKPKRFVNALPICVTSVRLEGMQVCIGPLVINFWCSQLLHREVRVMRWCALAYAFGL